MGSDDGNKRSAAVSWMPYEWSLFPTDSSSNLRHLRRRRIRIWMLRSSLCICMAIVSFLLLILRPSHRGLWNHLSPEYVLTDTFERRSSADYDALPSHCQALAKRFDACQASKAEKKRPSIVFACHRKWCNSFGHCEPCSVFADRWRFLIAQIDALSSSYTRLMTILHQNEELNVEPMRRRVANSKYDDTCHVHVKMDAPVAGVRPLASTLYLDPSSWLGELFHFRSYRVSDRKPLIYTDVLSPSSTVKRSSYFTHFTPHDYGVNVNYNACYFHILYQPDATLQEEIHRHWDWMRKPFSAVLPESSSTSITTRERDHSDIATTNTTQPSSVYTIGIYYWQEEDDSPVQNEKVVGQWLQLYKCALSFSEISTDDESVRFFLFTDNAFLKQYVRQEDSSVHVTGDTLVDLNVRHRPNPEEDDRQLWLDLYLLSQCDGIVTNALTSAAPGNSTTTLRVHPFPVLAKKIGFLSNTQFHECIL